MTRAIPLALAATLAMAGSQGAFATGPTACPDDRKALVALLKSLKVEHKWDDPEAPNPDARHYKPGSLHVLGLAPNDVFVLYRGGAPESVTFRFTVRELQTLTPAFQAAYPTARCSSPQGCAVDPRGAGSRPGELVLASLAAGDSEYLGATLSCRYLGD